MAMTKAEQKRVEELETALALCWPNYAQPSQMTREQIKASLKVLPIRDKSVYRSRKGALGWFFNAYTGSLTQGWSDGVSHNSHSLDEGSATQGIGRIYRSREEAAMALRLDMSRGFAGKLAAVDRIIRGEA